MPRSLSRLRYRTPKPAVVVPRMPARAADIDPLHPRHDSKWEAHVARYVVRESTPRHLRLQTVVNPKAKGQPTGRFVPPPARPSTLRDVVDPASLAQHGEIIYVFRNTKSNQIIYSLQELLDKHHLEQLPFIGKHSKPPTLRPDEWTPHCVITFPTAQQGHNAFRKLREFRRLHELSWNKTNPEYRFLPLTVRMKKIMDQRANMSADLAEVLRLQEQHGEAAQQEQEEQQTKAAQIIDKKWKEIDKMATAAASKEKLADNVKWLAHQVRSLTLKLQMKHNQNDADQKRLTAAKQSLETRLHKVEYAVRKADQYKHLATRDARPENAKDALDARDHHVLRSVLPPALQKPLPVPYSLADVSVLWADIQDALYAAGSWPEAIQHDTLPLNKARAEISLLTAEAFETEVGRETWKVVEALRAAGEARRLKHEMRMRG